MNSTDRERLRTTREYTIVVLGEEGVGKSTLTYKYFPQADCFDPTLEENTRTSKTIDGEQYIVTVLDTAGMEAFQAMREAYYKTGDGFVFQYSIAEKGSMDKFKEWRDQILVIKGSTNVPVVLMGNKCDLPDNKREVTYEEGKDFAEKLACPFFETSAKDYVNVEEAFTEVVRAIRRQEDFEKAKTESQPKPKREWDEQRKWDEQMKCCGGCIVV